MAAHRQREPMGTTFILEHEPRPGDFSARIKRSRQRSIAGHRRNTHGRSTLAILGAFAIPAFAQPSGWDRFQIGNAASAEATVLPMPFEQAGNSFPGSAFYYLEFEDDVPGFGEDVHSVADDNTPAGESGEVARPLRAKGSRIDRDRAEQCLTTAIYYEAASESESGQRAVAQVVLNRVAHPSYPRTVCGVVYQGSERSTGCQFSFTCDGSLERKPGRYFWNRARKIAKEALSGYVHAPAGLATHYHTIQVDPFWASSLSYLGTIGAHRFYSFKGAAGRKATFRFAYRGAEPLPAPHSPVATASVAEAAPDPVAIQLAFVEPQQSRLTQVRLQQANAEPAGTAQPAYSRELAERGGDALLRGVKLPGAAGIRPEYRNSGQWIAQPDS